MSNTLNAIINLIQSQHYKLSKGKPNANRIQSVGTALESFVKDFYAGTFLLNSRQKNQKYAKVFSYLGKSNSPPDLILRNGDAIEVKKIDTLFSELQLNSSYPKHKLRVDNPLISQDCKVCEEWTEKDIIYAIGSTSKKNLRSLWLVYGDCYAADINIYSNLKTAISNGIKNIKDVNFEETNELGRVNSMDPLGITNLRIRGMWIIQNPYNLFSDIVNYDNSTKFQLNCLMRNTKFLSFDNDSILALEGVKDNNLDVADVLCRDPNNPNEKIKCKLITYKIF